MNVRKLHRWEVSPSEARRIQERLRARMESEEVRQPTEEPRFVAGADVAFRFGKAKKGRKKQTSRGEAIAGVIVYRWPEMQEVERASTRVRLRFPYVPGLLSFREAPALLAAFRKVKQLPDVVFVDGQGYAHPRRFGIACHLGMLLNVPTVGCAKSRLIGENREPGTGAGCWEPLQDAGETIGAVLRTRTSVKPIFVSAGYQITLGRALDLTIHVCDGYRIPRPTREADHWVESLKRPPDSRTERESSARVRPFRRRQPGPRGRRGRNRES